MVELRPCDLVSTDRCMIARHLKSPALIALMVTMESQLRSGQSDVEEQTNMMVMKWTPTRASVVFLPR